jgi:hypothetical protein
MRNIQELKNQFKKIQDRLKKAGFVGSFCFKNGGLYISTGEEWSRDFLKDWASKNRVLESHFPDSCVYGMIVL